MTHLNHSWPIGKRYDLTLRTLPAFLDHFNPRTPLYDELLPLRYRARQAQDWRLADAIRDYAELAYGYTIIDSPIAYPEDGHDFQHFRPVRLIAWYKKWRPYIVSHAYEDTWLDRLATRGLMPYAPGWAAI
ncbi:MAG TPA: hypothetical protein VFU72_03030 [Nitrolancea sp.]|nr:hypothetical protein [Nitrolancea sp.]